MLDTTTDTQAEEAEVAGCYANLIIAILDTWPDPADIPPQLRRPAARIAAHLLLDHVPDEEEVISQLTVKFLALREAIDAAGPHRVIGHTHDHPCCLQTAP